MGALDVSNSTFAGNTSYSCGAFSGNAGWTGGLGGAIYAAGATTITNSTFADNGANFGPTLEVDGGTVQVVNSIFKKVLSSSGNCEVRNGGVITSKGYNIEDVNTCFLTGPGDQFNTNPLLGSLGNYGGSTQTIPLLAGSPAIDAAYSAVAPATDQRGFSRNGLPDIGAFEYWPGGIPGNNAPVISSPLDPYSFNVNEDTYASFQLAASDPDGDPYSFSISTLPLNGYAWVTPAGVVNYIGNPNFNNAALPDSFVVSVSDPYVSTLLHVNPYVQPVNDPPSFVNTGPVDVYADYTGAVHTLTPADLYATDVDNTPAQLTYTITQAPVLGVLYRFGVPLGVNSTFTQAD
ncbi:MAG: hypothetical protein D6816_01155, partial [Bacteroidetes bacterium]